MAGDASLALIRASLDETRAHLGVKRGLDWSETFYQYANRLAHLYLLRTLNKLPAWLLFVHFVGDSDMGGPATVEDWAGS